MPDEAGLKVYHELGRWVPLGRLVATPRALALVFRKTFGVLLEPFGEEEGAN